MSLCTHGVQTGEGYECSSCVTSPTFAQEVDTHLQRLAAERPDPVTPAEERTGVSDVRAAVLEEVAALRFDLRNGIGIERSERVTARLDRIEQWVRGERQ